MRFEQENHHLDEMDEPQSEGYEVTNSFITQYRPARLTYSSTLEGLHPGYSANKVSPAVQQSRQSVGRGPVGLFIGKN